MRVEFAAYGELAGAHAVLGATFDDPIVESTLTITDLAWGIPDHLGETPMYRARPNGTHYIIVKTVRDTEASRSGMASSVAAFFPLEEVINVCDFAKLVEVVPTPSHTLPKLESLSIVNSPEASLAPDVPEIHALANALLTRDSTPAVCVGIDSFIGLIANLWSRLPQSLRKTLAFAFVCDPSDSNKRECSVVYCPESLASRWTGQLVTKRPNQPSAQSTSELYLFADRVRREVDRTIDDLGAAISTFSDLRRACLCHDTIRDLASASNLDATKLLRNIAILSPASQRGLSIKASVTKDIGRRIKSDGVPAIGLIRNIDFDLFGTSKDIAAACSAGIQKSLLSQTESAGPIAELIEQAATHGDRAWGRGVLDGVQDFVQSGHGSIGSRVWEIFEARTALVDQDATLLPSRESDAVVAESAPEIIGDSLADSLKRVAVQRRFPQLHAVTLASTCTIEAALETLHDTWLGEELLASLRRLGMRVDPKKLLEYLDGHDRPEFIEVVVEMCVNDQELLATGFLGHSRPWRLVLARIVEESPEAVHFTEALEIEIWKSIRLLLREGLEPEYQVSLAKTKYANLLGTESRSQLWGKMHSDCLPKFLNATARAWIRAVHKGQDSGDDVEPELRAAILSSDMRATLLPSTGDGTLQVVMNVFGILPQLNEDDFEQWRQWFLNSNRNLSKMDAILLGKFVNERKWERVAANIASDVSRYSRSDLRPAVSRFLNLLHWLTRWGFDDGEVSVSPDEWWAELEGTLIGLFPEGPSYNGTWERAGGDPADLLTHGTGANQWRHCLRELRNGIGSGTLTIDSLFQIVTTDYSNNSTLKVLAETQPK